jgi:hypothetical protein
MCFLKVIQHPHHILTPIRLQAPCQGNSGQGKGCQFDYNNYAKWQGVIVDKKTGYIDLKNTTKKINFNTLIYGQYLITRIYYKLNDNSNNAPQMIQLKLI